MEPITITGLTAHQVKLLDHMWSLSDIEDVEAWQATLDPASQKQVDVLMHMVVLAATDEMLVQDTGQAQQVLAQFRL